MIVYSPTFVAWDTVQSFFDRAVRVALNATCLRSKCGAIIFAPDKNYIAVGCNSPPNNIAPVQCLKETLPIEFKSDKTCCMHAEQRAVMNALRSGSDLMGSRLYFVRLNKQNKLEPSGMPYCTICSKLALDVGIAEWCLVHHADVWGKEGAYVYDARSYNAISFGRSAEIIRVQ